MKVICVNDQVKFDAKRATARFCSPKCRVEYSRKGAAAPEKKSREAKASTDKVGYTKTYINSRVEAKAQTALISKEERLKRMNERLAARGRPLISEKPEPVTFISTGIAQLDALTAEGDEMFVGGFPRKHITEIFGPKGTGKTSLMKLIASHNTDLQVLYIDAENGLLNPPDHIDVSKSTLLEDIEDIVFEGVRSALYDLIIIDSTAVMTSVGEMEDGKAGMGAKPKAMAKFVRRVNAALRPVGPDGYPSEEKGTAVIFVNQLRDTMASFGVKEYTPGGRSIEYAASLRLELRSAKADLIAKDGFNIGQNVRVRVEKSRFGAKDASTKFKLMYEQL